MKRASQRVTGAEGGPCRSGFWVQIFVIEPNRVECLRSQIFFKSVQPFLRYGYFWFLTLQRGQNWGKRKKSLFLIRISCLLNINIRPVKTTFWMYFGLFWLHTGWSITYMLPETGLTKKCFCYGINFLIFLRISKRGKKMRGPYHFSFICFWNHGLIFFTFSQKQ